LHKNYSIAPRNCQFILVIPSCAVIVILVLLLESLIIEPDIIEDFAPKGNLKVSFAFLPISSFFIKTSIVLP